MASWSRGYGDFVLKPDIDTLRPLPWLPGTRDADGRRRVGGRVGRRGVAAADPAPPAGAARRARLGRRGGHRARVHRVPRHLRGGVAQGLPRPRAGQPLQRRLLPAGHRAGRAAAARDPQPHGGRGHAGRGLQGRVQPRPARDQLPLRPGAAQGRRALDLQERRQGDRLPAGLRDHVHGEVRRARGLVVPHPLLAAVGERRGAGLRARPGVVRALRRRPARVPARADAVLRAEHQLLQALRGGLVRPHRGRVGQGQPDVLDPRRRPRRRPALREPPAGGGRQSRTWRSRR